MQDITLKLLTIGKNGRDQQIEGWNFNDQVKKRYIGVSYMNMYRTETASGISVAGGLSAMGWVNEEELRKKMK